MRHARRDYDRFQDPEGKIPEDEPVFLLRGQDMCAPAALIKYAEMLESVGAEKEMVDAVNAHVARMWAWQEEHFPTDQVIDGHRAAAGKVPDADKAVLR